MLHRTRPLLVSLVAAGLLATGLAAPAAAARPDPGGWSWPDTAGAAPAAPASRAARATAALTRVQRLFRGGATTDAGRDATMALRDLWLLRPALSAADRARADRYLARPTDGGGDPLGDGYTVAEATPVCGTDVCIHYVTSTDDAVPPADGPDVGTVPDYVDFALATMEHVHQTYVGAGYRAPKPDGTKGDNSKTDIYLADVGADSLYGYCTSDDETPLPSGDYDVWAYCVLDNDYSPAEFPTNTPEENFEVTAAHEYYHAVQAGYDWAEDAWFMEATATWAEDEVYDAVDDNVQYLPAGQLGDPHSPLDVFYGSIHYGNWVFFRYLTERFPQQAGGLPVLVRTMWRKADSDGSAPDMYSTQAIAAALRPKKVSFTQAFAQFSAVNRFSRKFYEEGRANAYPQAPIEGTTVISKAHRSDSVSGRLTYQLTSVALQAKPRKLTGTWKLQVSADMAPARRGPAVVVDQVRRNGTHAFHLVRLNRKGVGSVKVPFTNAKTARVVITLVSGGIHYSCWVSSPFACSGDPKDDNLPVKMSVRLTR